MDKRVLAFALLCIFLLLLSCTSVPEHFRSGTEFGLHLNDDLNTNRNKSRRLNMTVAYPEGFRDAIVEGSASVPPNNDQNNNVMVTVNSLLQDEKRICVRGDLIAVANSKGVRGQDDNGTATTVQHITSTTTTMITQQMCSGTPDQQSCYPVTYPMEVPGPTSILLHVESSSIRLKPGSLMIFQLYDQQCLK